MKEGKKKNGRNEQMKENKNEDVSPYFFFKYIMLTTTSSYR